METALSRIVIDDWDAPQFSAAGTAALAQVAASAPAVPLTPDTVLVAATAETGLDDFGEDGFREPLSLLCESLARDVALSPAGRAIALGMLIRFARNRLRIEDLIARHPEILDAPVDRPVFIAGLPRTGTSHLTNLIAADPQISSTRFWESLEPVLPDPQPSSEADDPRPSRAAELWGLMDTVLPHQKALHELRPDHVHEDIELMGCAFASNVFEGMLGPVRSYTDWFKSVDQTPAYRYLKRALQVLQWLRGGTRWVLKTPGHLEHLGALHAVFPDATCVFTHRDPLTITASCVTMEAYLLRLTVDSPDPRDLGAYWSQRVEDFMRACVRDRELIPADQSLDVTFQDFMADQLGVVERIYELAGLPFDAAAGEAMADYNEVHSRERHGRVDYDLRPFGIDPEERRRALRFYADRFNVPIES